MKIPTLFGVAALGAVLSFPAAAGLNGDIVTTALRAETADYGRFSAVVGAGIEGSLISGLLPFDFTDNGFTIQSPRGFCGIRSCGVSEVLALKLSGLDFGPGLMLTDVLLTTALSNVTVTIGPTFVEFAWIDQPIPQGSFLSAQFVAGAVPEPEAFTLMLAGLGLIGIAASRRSPRA